MYIMSTKSSCTPFSIGWEDDFNSSNFSNLSHHRHPISSNKSVTPNSVNSSITAPRITNIHYPHPIDDLSSYKQSKLYDKLVATMRKKGKKIAFA